MPQTEAMTKCMGCTNSLECNLTKTVRHICRGPYKPGGNHTSFWKLYLYIKLQRIISVRKAGQINL